MSLFEQSMARALLADAEAWATAVAGCRRRLQNFLQCYLPRFYRIEQRKTSEPVVYQAGRQRKPVQCFVGAGCWDDESVMAELRQHVAKTWADADVVLVLYPSAFAKSGADSCGVTRQWWGRLGKLDNCQAGFFWPRSN